MTDRLNAFLASKGLTLRRMDEEHFVDFFECGHDEAMDRWLATKALTWQREDMCAVWVLSPEKNDTEAIGFFTLSAHQIIPGNIDTQHRAAGPANRVWVHALQNPLPAQLLGKFAIEQVYQGQGYGALLMLCAYAKHLEAAEAAGAKFIVIDVQQEQLIAYYQDRYGFQRSGLVGEMAQMYRPTNVIRKDLDAALS